MERNKLKRLFKKAIENKISKKELSKLHNLLLFSGFPKDTKSISKSYRLIQGTSSPFFSENETELILNNIKQYINQEKKEKKTL